MDELVPFVRKAAGRGTMWVTGCSMGAFHAANFFFRRPDVFDGVIGLSGLYSARSFVGDHWDDATYFNSPLQYLPGLADPVLPRPLPPRPPSPSPWGRGSGRRTASPTPGRSRASCATKGIPAWFDYWGPDVAHDWPWWRRMLPYFLDRLAV